MLSNMNQRGEAVSPACYDAFLRAPFGRLGVKIEADRLAAVDLVEPNSRCHVQNEFAGLVCAQLEAYFADPRYSFTLLLALPGTFFQKRVWQALCKIPSGQVLSYGELALRLGSGARAIGNACRANPIPHHPLPSRRRENRYRRIYGGQIGVRHADEALVTGP